MSSVFISHTEEDADLGLEVAHELERAGYSTWYFERDSVPGLSYLLQTRQAIIDCHVFLVIISQHALKSRQIGVEVVSAHEADKLFLPLLRGVTQSELTERRPEWHQAMGAATSLEVAGKSVIRIMPRVLAGLRALGASPETAAGGVSEEEQVAAPIVPAASWMPHAASHHLVSARRRALVYAAIALVTLATGSVAWLLWEAPVWPFRATATSEPTPAVLATAIGSPSATATALATPYGPVPTVASPKQSATAPAQAATMPLPSSTQSGSTTTVDRPLISILRQFPAPGGFAEGITWDGQHLWVSENSGTIFKLDTEGRTLGAFRSPEVTPKGLAWDGEALWLFTTNYGLIYRFQLDDQGARTLSSFESPADVFGGGITDDMAWDGNHLWYANQYNVYELDSSGKMVRAFASPKNVSGLDWDGTHLWVAAGDPHSTATLSIVDAGWDTLASFTPPMGWIQGLAWGEDCLWAIGEDRIGAEMSIYQLDVSLAAQTVARKSDRSWQAQVLAARRQQVLRLSQVVPPTPAPQRAADEGMTFLVLDLGLKSPTKGALLYPEDLVLVDDQGGRYTPMGLQLLMPNQFEVGLLTGVVKMLWTDPPRLTFTFDIRDKTATIDSSASGDIPAAASSTEGWPKLVLVWLIPTEVAALRLEVPGAPAVEVTE